MTKLATIVAAVALALIVAFGVRRWIGTPRPTPPTVGTALGTAVLGRLDSLERARLNAAVDSLDRQITVNARRWAHERDSLRAEVRDAHTARVEAEARADSIEALEGPSPNTVAALHLALARARDEIAQLAADTAALHRRLAEVEAERDKALAQRDAYRGRSRWIRLTAVAVGTIAVCKALPGEQNPC